MPVDRGDNIAAKMPLDGESHPTDIRKADHEDFGARRGGFWIEPGVHRTLAIVAIDVIQSLRNLSATIDSAVSEMPRAATEVDWQYFSHRIGQDEEAVLARGNVYDLVAAICCEESLNRFLYFELPAGASDVIEKLQPTEKLLIVAAFLGESDMRSSHLYEGLKTLFDFRNRFAHGHNPGVSAKSLRKNHAIPQQTEQLHTIPEEVKSLYKTSLSYKNLVAWLRQRGRHPFVNLDRWEREADRVTEMVKCVKTRQHWSPPDADGHKHEYYRLYVDEMKLTRLFTASKA